MIVGATPCGRPKLIGRHRGRPLPIMLRHFSKKIISWYHKSARDLPWRRTKDPYKIWISEVMLQQTTVNAVIPYYERWIKEFPTVQSVAQAPLQRILKSWQGLGYYSRAKNIHKAAQIICKEYQGKLPDDPERIRKLPGFGPYTTGAVLSIAFNKRYPIIDANVRRVIMRFLAIEGFADTSQDKPILEFLEKVLPQKEMSSFNQALMELGALVCRNREALCLLCPVRNDCLGYQKGIQEIIPTPKKKEIKNIEVAIGILKKDGRYFIQKRPSKGLLADLWEFPGGKIEKGENPQEALRRELKEETGIEINSADHFMDLVHFYTQFRVNLRVFLCQPQFPLKEDNTHRWVTLAQLKSFPMPSGSAKIVDRLRKCV